MIMILYPNNIFHSRFLRMQKPSITYPLLEDEIEIVTHCPVCGGGKCETISEVALKDRFVFFSTDYCSTCGFVFRRRRPTLEWFKKSWVIRNETDADPGDYDEGSMLEKKRYLRYANLARAFEEIGCGKSVLDIGTGPGTGLKAFHDRGWRATGVEPDPSRAKIGRERGLEIIEAPMEDFSAGGSLFDVVTIIHTVEHLQKPLELLRNIRGVIKNSGYLYIEVPDIHCFVNARDSLYLEHMNNFSEHTLRLLGERGGFTPIFRFFPKAQHFGIVHLGMLFMKDDAVGGQREGVAPSDVLVKIRKRYVRGLPVPQPAGIIRFSVNEINDVVHTISGSGSEMRFNPADQSFYFANRRDSKNFGFLPAASRLVSKWKKMVRLQYKRGWRRKDPDFLVLQYKAIE